MPSSRRSAPAACALLLLGGCALILDGTSQEVSFDSDPPGAVVTVAGQTATTPATLNVPKGDHEVVFELPGHEPSKVLLTTGASTFFYFDFIFSILFVGVDLVTGAWRAFETTSVRSVLRPLPNLPEIRPAFLTSTPSGAEVLVDGVLCGRTPLSLELSWPTAEREKTVHFRLPEHEEVALALPRHREVLHALLRPMPARARTVLRSTPPGAEAFVDGRAVGRTPVSLEFEWIPGAPARALEISAAGYEPWKKEFGRGDAEIHAELRERIEEIALPLEIAPPGTWVQVDGDPARPADTLLRLPWSISVRRHRLTFSHPGYLSKTLAVDFDAAGSPLTVRLEPLLPLGK
jgi:hypothetical protein